MHATKNIDFSGIAVRTSSRLVVWTRSNVVSHAIGMVRASLLRKKCSTNNVRLNSPNAKHCALKEHEAIPVETFEKRLREVSFYHALHMGVAYRHWGADLSPPPSSSSSSSSSSSQTQHADRQRPAGHPCQVSPPTYGMYYEELLADKEGALRRLFQWLGQEALLGNNAPNDKTIKATPAGLRSFLANFEELEDFLASRAPCYLSHLRSNGEEVVPVSE